MIPGTAPVRQLGRQLRYAQHRFLYRSRRSAEWVFVVPNDRWLLNGICEEVAAHGQLDAMQFSYSEPIHWPEAKTYFFSHHHYLVQFLRTYWRHQDTRKLVFFTHYSGPPEYEQSLVHDLNQADVVFCMATMWQRWLIERGLPEEKTCLVYGGADPVWFQAGRSPQLVVGLCSGYQGRKGGERLLELVRRLPHMQFL